MVQPNEFEQHEQLSNGQFKFILCPHLAERGYPDREAKFVNIVDGPERVITLALCGVCTNIVTGALADRIVKTIADNALLDVEKKIKDAIEEGLNRA